jgi:hypothetical protein
VGIPIAGQYEHAFNAVELGPCNFATLYFALSDADRYDAALFVRRNLALIHDRPQGNQRQRDGRGIQNEAIGLTSSHIPILTQLFI